MVSRGRPELLVRQHVLVVVKQALRIVRARGFPSVSFGGARRLHGIGRDAAPRSTYGFVGRSAVGARLWRWTRVPFAAPFFGPAGSTTPRPTKALAELGLGPRFNVVVLVYSTHASAAQPCRTYADASAGDADLGVGEATRFPGPIRRVGG